MRDGIGVCVRRGTLLAALGVLAVRAATAAPQIGPLGGGIHGVGFVPEEGAGIGYGIRIVATSRGPADIAPQALPAELAAGVGDTDEGLYARDEWDKGAMLRDGWSARWSGELSVDRQADYTFYLTTDDGARLTVDGDVVVDAWVPRPPTTSEVTVSLAAGRHRLVVEFFEAGGGAVARLEWSAEGLERQVVPADRVTADDRPGWRAQYYQNAALEGDPIVAHVETIDTDWGDGGPRIGEEEPGRVVFEWVRVGPGAILGRLHSGPQTKLGILAQGVGRTVPGQFRGGADGEGISLSWTGTPTFAVKPIGGTNGLTFTSGEALSSVWAPPTEGSLMFAAGFEPLPRLTLDAARAALHNAFLAGVQPDLPPGPPDADGWITLFDGDSKDGWAVIHEGLPDLWKAGNGILKNDGGGGKDIHTVWTFGDFDLHIEFNCPPGSNSGVYLQGRYEIQVDDCFGQDVRNNMCGAIYGKIAPSVNAAKRAGEWQAFDVTFTAATIDDDGRVSPARVTVRHNDILTIENGEIDGVTGSAMDDRVLEPGPLMLQGTHGPVEYRSIRIRPD